MTARRSTYERPTWERVRIVATLGASALASSAALTFVIVAGGAR